VKKISQKGFTLVELAIVLMIIGLLIGGILKGQELIENARIISLARQIQSYNAAFITFQDSYGALPGDILNPGTRIPNCGATPATISCNASGNNNGKLDYVSGSSLEYYNFWHHLFKANMISGIDTSLVDLIPPKQAAGQGRMNATGYYDTSDILLNLYGDDMGSLSGSQAARLDRKIDDGKPRSGDMTVDNDADMNAYTSVPCYNGTSYSENEKDERSCWAYIRLSR
jgi:prepilin-type N-terminal cleavage/methylation domain-containing protein